MISELSRDEESSYEVFKLLLHWVFFNSLNKKYLFYFWFYWLVWYIAIFITVITRIINFAFNSFLQTRGCLKRNCLRNLNSDPYPYQSSDLGYLNDAELNYYHLVDHPIVYHPILEYLFLGLFRGYFFCLDLVYLFDLNFLIVNPEMPFFIIQCEN